jgi:hypothetical protein
MHRLTLVLIILVATLAGTAQVVADEDDGVRPRAVPIDPIKDFGTVAKGETLVHEFGIQNKGSAPLEVTEVRPACGCTVVEFQRTIAPGAIGRIQAAVRTDNYAGPISKSIAVFTNDAENPKLQLTVRAEVKPYIKVIPGFARFNYVKEEPIGVVAQSLWAEEGGDLAIVSVKSPYDHLEVSCREATEDELHPQGRGRQWRLEIALDPESPVGALSDYVEIEVDHPKQKTVRIPISGFVRPRQHVTPPEVDLGQLEGASLPLKRTLSFTNFISDAIELKDVETSIEGLSIAVEASARQPGHRFKLILTVGPGVPKGEFSTTIEIHTTDPLNPIVELPVKGTIL